MKKKAGIAVMIALCAVASVASAEPGAVKSRADVTAEFERARSMGQLSAGEDAYPVADRSSSARARSDVQAELARALQTREISEGEAVNYPILHAGPGKTRAQVQDELRQYRASSPDQPAA